MTRKDLEQLAISAHQAGMTWAEFLELHRRAVGQIELWDRAAYHQLVRRLSHLLTCGDTGGQEPIDTAWERPCDWELDDLAASNPTGVGIGG